MEEQNGFRKGHFCEDHLFVLNSIIQNKITANKSTFCAFIDLKKTFNHIDRDLLLFGLLQYNIFGKIYHAIQICIQTPIRLNQELTDWFAVTNGILQGDTLPYTLFALYINELAKEIRQKKS